MLSFFSLSSSHDSKGQEGEQKEHHRERLHQEEEAAGTGHESRHHQHLSPQTAAQRSSHSPRRLSPYHGCCHRMHSRSPHRCHSLRGNRSPHRHHRSPCAHHHHHHGHNEDRRSSSGYCDHRRGSEQSCHSLADHHRRSSEQLIPTGHHSSRSEQHSAQTEFSNLNERQGRSNTRGRVFHSEHRQHYSSGQDNGQKEVHITVQSDKRERNDIHSHQGLQGHSQGSLGHAENSHGLGQDSQGHGKHIMMNHVVSTHGHHCPHEHCTHGHH